MEKNNCRDVRGNAKCSFGELARRRKVIEIKSTRELKTAWTRITTPSRVVWMYCRRQWSTMSLASGSSPPLEMFTAGRIRGIQSLLLAHRRRWRCCQSRISLIGKSRRRRRRRRIGGRATLDGLRRRRASEGAVRFARSWPRRYSAVDRWSSIGRDSARTLLPNLARWTR